MFRAYVLATVFHLPPGAVQDEMSAVEIDELLLLHSQVCKFTKEQRG